VTRLSTGCISTKDAALLGRAAQWLRLCWLERWAHRNTGGGRLVQPDLVFIVLHLRRDGLRRQDGVGGIISGRRREGLVLAVARLSARGSPARPADEVVVHGVVVHAGVGDAGPVDIAVGHAYSLRSDPGSIRQHSAGDDTIAGSDVVVSGGELDAIVRSADHLVVVDAVKGRCLLRAVVGAALGLDAAAGIISLCGGIGIGTLNVGVVDFEWLVGRSARALDGDVIGNQATAGIVDHFIPAHVDARHSLHPIQFDEVRHAAIGAHSRQVTAVAIAEQAIQVARPVGTDHDGLLSVPIAGVAVHQYPTAGILNVVVFYIEPCRGEGVEEDTVGLALDRCCGRLHQRLQRWS
jgi:hypothetical protein